MDNLVWIGIRESEIKYTDFINNSICLFGKNNNTLEFEIRKRINHNNKKNFAFIDEFYNKAVIKQIRKNPNTKFMYYSQIYSYDCMKKLGLLDYIICLNDQKLIEFADNKFEVKKYLQSYIPILKYEFLPGKDCMYERLKEKYGNNDLVIQSQQSTGGCGTILLNENNQDKIRLDNNQIYTVTKYCKNNTPINIHVLISQNDIILMPISVQNIEFSNNRLIYKGYDFIKYNKITNKKIDQKIRQYAIIIGKILQKKGYRGILGIDSIIYENEVYFMEINPRFQNSSIILNKALKENNLPSLQELHYNCFYNRPIKLKNFSVNYSGYLNESETNHTQIKTKPIEILDKIDENFKYDNLAYLSTYVFDKQIL